MNKYYIMVGLVLVLFGFFSPTWKARNQLKFM